MGDSDSSLSKTTVIVYGNSEKVGVAWWLEVEERKREAIASSGIFFLFITIVLESRNEVHFFMTSENENLCRTKWFHG